MENHIYDGQDGLPCNTCGKMLYHEEHYGGSRAQAGQALREDKAATLKVDEVKLKTTVATPVRIRDSHPVYPGRRGIATHVEDRMCQVQLAPSGDAPVVLPMGFPWRYIEPLPLVVPTFSSPEEADEWLERHNPVITAEPAVPRFTSVEEADAWAAEERAKSRGWLSDAEAREAMGIPRSGGPPPPGQDPKPRTTVKQALDIARAMVGISDAAERAADSMLSFSSVVPSPGSGWMAEERIAMQVLKPESIVKITNLPF